MFSKLKNGSLKSIQLYDTEITDANDNAIAETNPFVKTCALILLHKSKFLVQYSLWENRPRKLSLIIKTKNLSSDVLVPAEITMKNNEELLIKDYSQGLWLANLTEIQQNSRSEGIDLFVDVKYLGSLLGVSMAMTVPIYTDENSNRYLYYYVPRDGAVVRWDSR